MSIKYLNDAWGMPLNPQEKIVLLAIADCANDEGHAYPGYTKLMEKTGLSKSALAKQIKILRDLGIIKIESHAEIGKGKSVNNYTISLQCELSESCQRQLIENIKEIRKKYSRAKSCHLEPRKVATENSKSCHLVHEPSVRTISKEPSVICETKVSPGKEKTNHIVHEIFDYWKEVMNHPKAKLDSDRTRTIKKALTTMGFTVDEIKKAILGCSRSPYHQGDNDKKTVYDQLGLILRNASNIERFIGLADSPPAKPELKVVNGPLVPPFPGSDTAKRMGL